MKKPFFTANLAFLTILFVAVFGYSGWAQEHEAGHHDSTQVQSHADSSLTENHSATKEKFNANETIIEHVLDAPNWHFADHLVLNLPVIVYSGERGLEVFSSSHFFDEHHNAVAYNGYKFEDHKSTSMVNQYWIFQSRKMWPCSLLMPPCF